MHFLLVSHEYDDNHNVDPAQVLAFWCQDKNETPTVRGLAADNSNKLYMETMIFLWNNHYNLNFNAALSDDSKK